MSSEKQLVFSFSLSGDIFQMGDLSSCLRHVIKICYFPVT